MSDGACPTCGTVLEAPARPDRHVESGEGDAEAEVEVEHKAPWHFKLLLVALILYLGYRAYQGIAWLIVHVPRWI